MTRTQSYKLNTGHRGNVNKIQDQVKLGFYSRECKACGCTITRKIYSNGVYETWPRFFKRKSCSKECKVLLLKGKNNPNYKGVMDIACKFCGKKGLWHHGKNNHASMCGNCYAENRGEPYNKKPTEVVNCLWCGKKLLNRFADGKLKPGIRRFCNSYCSGKARPLQRVVVNCIVCTKSLSIQPSRAKNKKCCSHSCAARSKLLKL
jgi:hypothetical protein